MKASEARKLQGIDDTNANNYDVKSQYYYIIDEIKKAVNSGLREINVSVGPPTPATFYASHKLQKDGYRVYYHIDFYNCHYFFISW